LRVVENHWATHYCSRRSSHLYVIFFLFIIFKTTRCEEQPQYYYFLLSYSFRRPLYSQWKLMLAVKKSCVPVCTRECIALTKAVSPRRPIAAVTILRCAPFVLFAAYLFFNHITWLTFKNHFSKLITRWLAVISFPRFLLISGSHRTTTQSISK